MFLSFLSVIGIRTMLAHVVLLDEKWVHSGVGIDSEADESHLGTLLHNLGIIDGIGR